MEQINRTQYRLEVSRDFLYHVSQFIMYPQNKESKNLAITYDPLSTTVLTWIMNNSIAHNLDVKAEYEEEFNRVDIFTILTFQNVSDSIRCKLKFFE